MKKAADPILAILMAATLVWSFAVPDAAATDAGAFQKPALARIFFWHFPSSIVLTGLLFVGAWFSFRLLRSPVGHTRRQWDARAISALELGFIHSCVTMSTGILFSAVQWGTPWHWDARQTSFLLFMLIYGAYFALRAAISDDEKREANSAAYMLAGLLPMVFLIFVFPRLPSVQQQTIHPNNTITKELFQGVYGQVILASVTLVSWLSVRLYKLRVRAELALLDHGNLETSSRSAAPDAVVRPVRLPKTDGA